MIPGDRTGGGSLVERFLNNMASLRHRNLVKAILPSVNGGAFVDAVDVSLDTVLEFRLGLNPDVA